MRARHVATILAAVLAAFIAGVTAATALHRRARRRLPAAATVAVPNGPAFDQLGIPDGVVLPFVRPPAPVPAPAPTGPAKCGDTGGRTKAGAPCAARAGDGGRCHHHRMAA